MFLIEDFKFHDLRHCFCTKLAQRGVDIYKIAKLAGHEDIRMTQRYSHLAPEHKSKVVKVLDEVLKSYTNENFSSHSGFLLITLELTAI